MRPKISAGDEYIIEYPFSRVTVNGYDEEGPLEYESWAPGVWHDEYGSYADGLGKMRIQVVDVHKPGKYPERVFYVRQWETPEGKNFGKKNLRITTTVNLRNLLKGYRHNYSLDTP